MLQMAALDLWIKPTCDLDYRTVSLIFHPLGIWICNCFHTLDFEACLTSLIFGLVFSHFQEMFYFKGYLLPSSCTILYADGSKYLL